MYIQITTRCNMECEHCGYACTSKGQDMSIKTFKNAIAFDPEIVSLGGGEPTIHRRFWEFIGLALGHCGDVWLATNGKKEETALALARMAKRGVLGCNLSRDIYHDQISSRVVLAFTKEKRDGVSGNYSHRADNDLRNIRDVTGKEINAGRCDFGENGCICSDLLCEPDGTVRGCGCKKAPTFGNINTDIDIPNGWEHWECYRDQQI